MFRPNMLFRKIEVLRGQPRLTVKCTPMFQNGVAEIVQTQGSNHIRYLGFPVPVRLTTDLSLTAIMDGTGQLLTGTKYIVFSYGPPLEAPLQETAERFLEKTLSWWQEWIKSTSIPGLFQKEVIRSALVLKLHQFEDTGAIIASGTTSLPESPGSQRNWDYRFCWLRDSYYSLRAFAEIGHFDELERFFQFILEIVANSGDALRPLYTISGSAVPNEVELPWPGYLGNGPVRLGNGATTQKQYDLYGQMLVSILPVYLDQRLYQTSKNFDPSLVRHLLEHMERDFRKPDAGIWEYRNRSQLHCYTYLFHWAGAQSGAKIAARLGKYDLREKAIKLQKLAEEHIEQCWDPSLQRFGQAIGEPAADASTLHLINMGYLDHGSEKAQSHLRSLESELDAPNGLFYRYKHADDFGAPDATFLATAFWRAEALACVGRVDEACKRVEQLLGFTNSLGLMSEDVTPDGGQWGNFPQTYSHVGLINTVNRIARKMDKPIYQEYRT
jgi:GH15 family glucan-1,4-alpha-glucosidase